jgi:hypothetical protein
MNIGQEQQLLAKPRIFEADTAGVARALICDALLGASFCEFGVREIEE